MCCICIKNDENDHGMRIQYDKNMIKTGSQKEDIMKELMEDIKEALYEIIRDIENFIMNKEEKEI